MTKPFLPAAALLASLAAPALSAPPAPAPMVELSGAVRCSALFGVVAGEQARGLAGALSYPAMATRGREFFVQTGARLMDAEGLSRPAVQARMQAEAARFQAESAAAANPQAYTDAAMAPCLRLLDAVIPPAPDKD